MQMTLSALTEARADTAGTSASALGSAGTPRPASAP